MIFKNIKKYFSSTQGANNIFVIFFTFGLIIGILSLSYVARAYPGAISNFVNNFATAFLAGGNPTTNYQGKLTTTSGIAVADNTYNIRFNLYTTSTGGTPIWTETHCYSSDGGTTCGGTGTDNRVAVTSGLFSTMLGSVKSLSNIDFNQTLYLGVEIGGTSTTPVAGDWDGEMSPRKAIGTVPTAFVANTLNGVSDSQFVRTDTTNATSSSGTLLTLTQNGTGGLLDIYTGSSKNFTITNGGNVGIGTSTPSTALSVIGTTTSTGLKLTSLASSFLAVDSSGNVIATTSPVSSQWTSNGTSVYYNNGNVGIGTTTPQAPLHVMGNTSAYEVARFQGATDISNHREFFSLFTTNPGYWWEFSNQSPEGDGTLNGLAFRERSGSDPSLTRVYFASGGNVGIGTTTPGYKLDVAGSINATSLFVNGVAVGAGGTQWTSASGGVIYYTGGSVGIGTTTPQAPLHVYSSAGGRLIYVFGPSNTTNTIDVGYGGSTGQAVEMGFNPSGDYGYLAVLGYSNSMLYLTSTGVGIGTSPRGVLNLRGYTGGTGGSAVAAYNENLVIGGAYNQTYNSGNAVLLHITDYSNDAGDNVYPIYVEDENNNVAFYINGGNASGVGTAYFGGNVGIGTTTPAYQLVLQSKGTTPTAGFAFDSNTQNLGTIYGPGGNFGIFAELPGSATGGFIQMGGSARGDPWRNAIIFGDSGSETMRIDGDWTGHTKGNVGIGTTTPAYKLTVETAGNIGMGVLGTGSGASGLLHIENSNATTSWNFGVTSGSWGTGTSGTLYIDKNGYGPMFVITPSGNVGIGTASPQGKLQIAGAFNNQGTGIQDGYDRPSISITGNFPQMVLMAGGSGNGNHGSTISLGAFDSGTSGSFKSWTLGTPGMNATYMDIGYGTNINPHLNGISGYGTTVMRFTSSGKVGIGTTAPIQALHVLGNISLGQYTGGDFTRAIGINDVGGTYTAGSTYIRFSEESGTGTANANKGGNIDFFNHLYNGGTNQTMRIQANGNVGIGVTSPTYKLQVNGQPAANGYTAWTNYSDERLKDNITPFASSSNSLERLLKINPVTYNYNSLTGYDEATLSRRISGFVAQDLQLVFPDMVGTTTINGVEYLDTNLSDLPLYLVQAIKEQQKQIMTFVSKIGDGITYLRNIVVETFAVGSKEKPSGITMYDEATGNPYCVKIVYGSLRNINGACDSVANTSNTSSSSETSFDYTATVLNSDDVVITPDNATTSSVILEDSATTTSTTSGEIITSVLSSSYVDAVSATTTATDVVSTNVSSGSEINNQNSSTANISTSLSAETNENITSTSTELSGTTETISTSTIENTPNDVISENPSTTTENIAESSSTAENVGEIASTTETGSETVENLSTTEENTSTFEEVQTEASSGESVASTTDNTSSEDSLLSATVFGSKVSISQGRLLLMVLIIQMLMVVAFGLYIFNNRKGNR